MSARIDQLTAELVGYAESVGADEMALNDLVHDVAQGEHLGELNALTDENEQEEHISAVEGLASEINNEGREEQIRYLLSQDVPFQTIRAALLESSVRE